jgi:hypothetical protein
MKKIIFSLSLIFSLGSIHSQIEKIKIKKLIKQSEMTSVATIAGFYYGNVSILKLLADKKIKISNNKDNTKIISFELTFINKGKGFHNFSQLGDSLGNDIIENLLKIDIENYAKIYISPIKAIRNNRDTIYLNPIELKLIKE